MFFRRGVSADRWLQVKMWLFSVGAILALLGMMLENDWVMGAAGVVLLAGFLLRFAPDTTSSDGAPSDDDDGGR